MIFLICEEFMKQSKVIVVAKTMYRLFICCLAVISISFLQACKNNSIGLQYQINDDEKTCTVIDYYGRSQTDVVVPATYHGYTVVAIADYAFDYQTIQSVTLPSTIKAIGEGAFGGCVYLEAVYGLENCTDLKEIQNSTFCLCQSLEYVVLPPNIVSIGENAFAECNKLENIELPNLLQSIGAGAFWKCYSLKNIDFPESVTNIGGVAFYQCNSLKEVTLPTQLSGDLIHPFIDCSSLENIYVSKNCLNYSSMDGVLFNKDLSALYCYPSMQLVERYEIPNGVEIIENYAFSYNHYLSEITIPQSVNTIYDYAFDGLVNLSTIKYSGTIKEWQLVKKGVDWDTGSANYIIYCTDGQIAKDGTITYN